LKNAASSFLTNGFSSEISFFILKIISKSQLVKWFTNSITNGVKPSLPDLACDPGRLAMQLFGPLCAK
jgi:hypothetical protein